jgi:glucose dehydrogenase
MRAGPTVFPHLALLACAACAAAVPPGTTPSVGRSPASVVSSSASTSTDWPSYNGTLEGTRYSTLTQITPTSAANLERVCTFDTGSRCRCRAAQWS